jgi:hypothetical protein
VIGGRVVIHLGEMPSSRENPWADDQARWDRRQLMRLEECPDGADVVIDLGSRRHVVSDAACWIHQHDERLNITVQGEDPTAVSNLVRASRTGDWRLVS